MLRTFIAFDTTPEIKRTLNELSRELQKTDVDARWEPMEKFHATVKFLGDTQESMQPEIARRIAQVSSAFEPIPLVFDMLGCFPNMRNPRVLWVGCKAPDPAIERLKTALDTALEPLGFETDRRSFHPHVTLARLKSDRGAKYLISSMEKSNFERFRLTVEELLLIKSVLGRDGSQYTVLQHFGLGSSTR